MLQLIHVKCHKQTQAHIDTNANMQSMPAKSLRYLHFCYECFEICKHKKRGKKGKHQEESNCTIHKVKHFTDNLTIFQEKK